MIANNLLQARNTKSVLKFKKSNIITPVKPLPEVDITDNHFDIDDTISPSKSAVAKIDPEQSQVDNR